ncbi:MAG: Rnf-Nqr domain containing protein, partial [Gammaproteobacteria bacterium]
MSELGLIIIAAALVNNFVLVQFLGLCPFMGASRRLEGAVGMVKMALNQLADQHIVELDDERRAAMVSNLLVVLCSDRDTQPVVNTGTL